MSSHRTMRENPASTWYLTSSCTNLIASAVRALRWGPFLMASRHVSGDQSGPQSTGTPFSQLLRVLANGWNCTHAAGCIKLRDFWANFLGQLFLPFAILNGASGGATRDVRPLLACLNGAGLHLFTFTGSVGAGHCRSVITAFGNNNSQLSVGNVFLLVRLGSTWGINCGVVSETLTEGLDLFDTNFPVLFNPTPSYFKRAALEVRTAAICRALLSGT